MKIIKEFFDGFKFFNKIIINLIITLILTPVYFAGIGLTKFIVSLFNIKTLEIKPSKNKKTYWIKSNYNTQKNKYRLF